MEEEDREGRDGGRAVSCLVFPKFFNFLPLVDSIGVMFFASHTLRSISHLYGWPEDCFIFGIPSGSSTSASYSKPKTPFQDVQSQDGIAIFL